MERTCARPGQACFRLLTQGSFRFACHPGVDCFNECCADLRLVLTPYDILRMKGHLGLDAEEFLVRYTVPHLDKGSPFPMLRLRMEEKGRKACPFVGEEGCSIYPNRPGACRLYPIGRGASAAGPQGMEQEFYFLVEEAHCHGFHEPRQWTLEEWLEDQGAKQYNEMNRPWMEIITSRSPRLKALKQGALQMFYMASYNLERFRRFVFTTRFLNKFFLAEEEVERIRQDDVALMLLGMQWLKFALMGEMTLELREP